MVILVGVEVRLLGMLVVILVVDRNASGNISSRSKTASGNISSRQEC